MFWRYTDFTIYYSGFCYQKVTLKLFSDSFLFLVSHCRSYVNVTDLSRFWDAKERSASEIEDSCQDQYFPFWTRFIYDNITNAMIPHNCTHSKANLTNPPCGSLYRGWIQGEHPSPEDGKYTALYFRVLFS